MNPTRKIACAAALALFSACGGSTSPQVERTNVWICSGGGCILPGHCADIEGGGAMYCNAYLDAWEATNACSPTDCTATLDPANDCMAVVSCPVTQ